MLPSLLKERGYSTHMVGKWHLGFCAWEYTPNRRGFDTFYGSYLGVLDHFTHVRDKYEGYDFHQNEKVLFNASGRYSTHLYGEEAVRIIEKREVGEETKKPFFLYLPFQALHAPMQVPTEYVTRFKDLKVSQERMLVLGMIAAMDEAVGKVVDALKRSGDFNNTFIIFTTDNGGSVSHASSNLPLRGTKGTLWEGGTRGAAFVHSPLLQEASKGTTNEGLIHVTDWMPTLASLAGVPKHQIEELHMDGIDQTDMLLKGKNSRRTEFVYNIKTSPFKAGYRMGDYKLLWGEHPKGDWFPPLQEDSRMARKLRNKIDWEEIQLKLMENENLIDLEENDWDMEDEKGVPLEDPVGSFDKLTRNQPAMLFDVMEDPEEKRDIAKENPKIVSVMKRRLKEASRTMRAGNFELKSILGHPFLRGGNFMPGWCVPEV